MNESQDEEMSQQQRKLQTVEEILLTLVQGENGEIWAREIEGWTPSSKYSVCYWDGVICDPLHNPEHKIIQGLVLPQRNLVGTLPSELGLIKTLIEIDMPNNGLKGSIPAEVAALPLLELVKLSNNDLTGTIPQFSSPHLEGLDLSDNSLTGQIPFNIGQTNSELRTLDLLGNSLTGSIPYSLTEMTKLQTLSLSQNQLTGTIPASIGNMPKLEFVYLDGNILAGTLPVMKNEILKELWVMDNALSGTIPSSLVDLDYLFNLYIDGNKFTGTIPTELCDGRLNSDYFTNETDGKTTGMTSTAINCANIACPSNTFSSDGLHPCTPCPSHQTNPYLGQITDSCVDTTDQGSLVRAFLHGVNREVDTSIPHCAYVGVACDTNDNVVSITFPQAGLMGTIAREVGFLRFLRVLDLSDNNLSGYVPAELKFAPLERLDVAGNRFLGIVPESLCYKAGLNGNGMNGEFTCDHIACPIGQFSPLGTGSVADPKSPQCQPCLTARFIGSKSCHHDPHLENGHLKSPEKIAVGGMSVELLVFVCIGGIFLLAGIIFTSLMYYDEMRIKEMEKARGINDWEFEVDEGDDDDHDDIRFSDDYNHNIT